jgi:hypothetical protein
MNRSAPEWVPAGHRADWLALRKVFGGAHADAAIRATLDRIAKRQAERGALGA